MRALVLFILLVLVALALGFLAARDARARECRAALLGAPCAGYPGASSIRALGRTGGSLVTFEASDATISKAEETVDGTAECILVHGMRGNANAYRCLVDALLARFARVHVVEPAGFGANADEPASLSRAQAAVLQAARERPGVPMVAFGLGAAAAERARAWFPEAFAALVPVRAFDPARLSPGVRECVRRCLGLA